MRLKRERTDGYLLAHGGTRFARSLVETGLIDEYRLLIHPTVPGAGERLFLAPGDHRADKHHRLQRRSRRPRLRGALVTERGDLLDAAGRHGGG
jgi:riboflavin biosynthesis pyrimidine reductase